MTKLILWDVDGTLIHSRGIGSEVFDRAFAQVLGLAPTARITERVRLGGKTDPEIALEYLALMEVEEPQLHLPQVLALLEAELALAAEALAANGAPHPGVPELLARLAATDGVYQTLLTGNLEANAAVKVTAFGLDRWLDLKIGAYGSDDHDRCQLVPVALERAARLRGLDVSPADAWVVGDTERDLACARAGGARCLLVATGNVAAGDLAALDPDALLADLSDVDAAYKILTA